jgi:hypothetical protein
MEPIEDSDGVLLVFNVGRGDSDLWLIVRYDARPSDVWDGGCRFVFRSRK